MPVFYGAIDLGKNELRNAVIQNLGAAPASPVKGQVYFDSTANVMYYYNGTVWVSTAGGSLTVSAQRLLGNPTGASAAQSEIPLAADMAFSSGSLAINTFSGDVNKAIGSALTRVIGVNAVPFNTLATGLLKNTTGTGVPSIAVAADVPVVPAGTSAAGAMSAQSRLDQIALANPATASISANSQNLTNVKDPVNAQDGATKNYVDTTAQGLDAKLSVKAATTANITLSAPQTVDGIALVAGDRCLVKNQTTASANGIYVVNAAAWTRATDMDAWSEVPGAFVFVEQGTVNADTGWVSTADAGGTLNTTAITWTQFSGAGTYTAGVGLTLTGTQFAVDQTVIAPLASPTFTGDPKAPTAAPGDNDTSVATTAFVTAAVSAATTGAAKKYAGALAGTASPETITHNLNTRDVQVTVLNGASPYTAVEVDWDATTANSVTVRYNPALGAGYRIVVVG